MKLDGRAREDLAVSLSSAALFVSFLLGRGARARGRKRTRDGPGEPGQRPVVHPEEVFSSVDDEELQQAIDRVEDAMVPDSEGERDEAAAPPSSSVAPAPAADAPAGLQGQLRGHPQEVHQYAGGRARWHRHTEGIFCVTNIILGLG